MDSEKQQTPEERGPIPLSEVITEAMDRIHSRTEDPARITGIPSGLSELDVMTGGFQKSHVIVIGGRPSMGKTGLALSICDHALREPGRSILYVTLGDDEFDLTERLLSMRASVPWYRIHTGQFVSDDEWWRLGRAYDELKTSRFWIYAPTCATMPQIADHARGLRDRQGVDMIVVDTLQKVKSEAPNAKRKRQVVHICRQLRQLARELQVPIIVLSQLRRRVEHRESHRPRYRDFKGPGVIWDTADVAIMIHRPEYFDPEDQPGMAELLVLKNHRGRTGEIKVAFQKEFRAFGEIADRLYDISGTF